MRSLRVLAGLAALLTITAAASFPAAHPLVGKWSIEYERGRRMMNGEATVTMGKATLEISEKGDSLVGTMTPEAPAGGSAPPPSQLSGKGSGTSATLKSNSASRVNMNGEERSVNILVTWELKAEGDNLTGTMARALADMPAAAAPTPVKGTRMK